MARKKSQNQVSEEPLARRERQIMDIVFARGSATAREIWESLDDPPTYATVRTILRVLERKGHLDHSVEGKTFVYAPTRCREVEAASALRRLVQTFFDGSVERAVSGLLRLDEKKLDAAEVDRIEKLIAQADSGPSPAEKPNSKS
ncbi:MAG: BlaI/MecI/CopY family transcriptional regulator [Verrucomicrobiales bacterium]